MTLTLENITKTVGGETHIDDVSMTLELSHNFLIDWDQCQSQLKPMMRGRCQKKPIIILDT